MEKTAKKTILLGLLWFSVLSLSAAENNTQHGTTLSDNDIKLLKATLPAWRERQQKKEFERQARISIASVNAVADEEDNKEEEKVGTLPVTPNTDTEVSGLQKQTPMPKGVQVQELDIYEVSAEDMAELQRVDSLPSGMLGTPNNNTSEPQQPVEIQKPNNNTSKPQQQVHTSNNNTNDQASKPPEKRGDNNPAVQGGTKGSQSRSNDSDDPINPWWNTGYGQYLNERAHITPQSQVPTRGQPQKKAGGFGKKAYGLTTAFLGDVLKTAVVLFVTGFFVFCFVEEGAFWVFLPFFGANVAGFSLANKLGYTSIKAKNAGAVLGILGWLFSVNVPVYNSKTLADHGMANLRAILLAFLGYQIKKWVHWGFSCVPSTYMSKTTGWYWAWACCVALVGLLRWYLYIPESYGEVIEKKAEVMAQKVGAIGKPQTEASFFKGITGSKDQKGFSWLWFGFCLFVLLLFASFARPLWGWWFQPKKEDENKKPSS